MAKFSRFNKVRLFSYDTSLISDYVSLEDLYTRDGDGTVYELKGVYISNASEFADESPVVAIDGYYVNIPQHQLSDIKAMLEDRDAIRAINEGAAGFTIRTYEQRRFHKTCYTAEWCDL